MRADRSAQKLTFFWHFLGKRPYFLGNERFYLKSWHIYGTYAPRWSCTKIAKNCKKLNFFWQKVTFTPILSTFCPNHGTLLADMHLHKNCKKLNFFWHFLGKSAQNLGNEHFSAKIPADNGRYRADPKCAKNCNFFQKSMKIRPFWAEIAYFGAILRYFRPKSWIFGHISRKMTRF